MISVLARQQSWQRQHSFKQSSGSLTLARSDSNVSSGSLEELPPAKALSPVEALMEQITNYVRSGVAAPPSVSTSRCCTTSPAFAFASPVLLFLLCDLAAAAAIGCGVEVA